jgi:hypothetical protein
MRRISICLAVIGAVLLVPPVATSAAPDVKFKALAVAISGYPETGNLYNGGAAVQAEYLIKGTEYEGSPPPLSGINFYLPKGVKLNTKGWKTCSKSVLEPSGPGAKSCPPASHAGPLGLVRGFVTLGGERVKENATLESFYAPGGGLLFFTAGHNPVSLEILSSGRYLHLGGSGGFGPELETQIPLVESLPGAPYASVESITVKTGSARGPRSPKKAIYYGTLPKKGSCPKQGFKVKSEVIFAAVGGLPRQVVTKTYNAPCPRRTANR